MNTHEQQELNREKERTLRAAWMISLAAPVTTLAAFILGGAAVQLADFLRRSSELVGLFFAWWTFRRTGGKSSAEGITCRLEHITSLVIAAAMILSFLLIAYSTVQRLLDPQPLGMITPGLVIPIGGIAVNGWFWRRGSRLARRESSPVIESQWRLCRAKTVLDVCVLLTLVLTILMQELPASRYIDTVGSGIIGIFLLVSAWRIGHPAAWALRTEHPGAHRR